MNPVRTSIMRELLLFTSLFAATFGRRYFEGHQVLRITASNALQINLLKNLTNQEYLKLDVWRGPVHESLPVDIRIPLISLQAVKDFLKNNEIQYEIKIRNLQHLLDKEQREMMRSRNLQPKTTDEFDYTKYHTMDEIYNFIDMLAQENPNLVSKIVIGKSYENRPLIVLKFSTGPKRPGFWIDFGIHAREWISPACGIYFAKKIATDCNRIPAMKSMLEKLDIFLEIVVNPDGYDFTHKPGGRLWRKSRRPIANNCIGVDLNRNWDAKFGGPGSSDDPCRDTYRGPKPHSEPEVNAIVDFVKSHGQMKAFVTFHSYSQMLLYPYGYTDTPCKHDVELNKLAKKAVDELASRCQTKYKYGSIIKTIYESNGGSIDWAYDQGIKYSYAFELRDTGCYGFLLPAHEIYPTAEETWLALMAIMEHVKNMPY